MKTARFPNFCIVWKFESKSFHRNTYFLIKSYVKHNKEYLADINWYLRNVNAFKSNKFNFVHEQTSYETQNLKADIIFDKNRALKRFYIFKWLYYLYSN